MTDTFHILENVLPAKTIRRIARLVKLPERNTLTTDSIRCRLDAWIYGEGGLRALAVKLSHDEFMEVVNVIGTKDLRDELFPILSDEKRETLSREKCIALMENAIFRRENYKAMNWFNMPHEWIGTVREVHHRRDLIFARERQEKELREREEEERIRAHHEYCRQRREAEELTTMFQNAQRTLALQVTFITRYLQAKPATAIAALPATIEHHEQAQPAVVQEQASTDNTRNYELDHISFIRGVKNGHVSQSVLAELSTEEYAQVMQEVKEMEAREQERERAEQAQHEQTITPDNIAQVIVNAKDKKEIFSALSSLSTPQLKTLADSERISLDSVAKNRQAIARHIADIISNRLDQLKAGNSIEIVNMWGLPSSLESPITFAFWNSLLPAGQPRLQQLPDGDGKGWNKILRANIYHVLDCETEQDMRNLLMTAGKNSQLDRMCDFFGCNVDPCDSRDSKINALIAQANRYNAEHPKAQTTTTTSTFQPQPAPVKKSNANPNFGTIRGMSTRELREIAKRLGLKDCAKMSRLQLEEAISRKPRKFPSRAYDFSYCINDKKLRRELSTLDADNVEIIARNLKGKTIELPDNGKPLTKKFLIDAIVQAYFPNAQTAPASTHKPIRVTRNVFIAGNNYYKCLPFDDVDITTIQVITILERNGVYLTIREEDTGFISRRKIRIDHDNDEYIKLSNCEHDIVYSTSKLSPDPVPITSRKFPRFFLKVQRTLAREAITLANYLQANRQPLALPAVVEHQDTPAVIPEQHEVTEQPQHEEQATPNPELFRRVNQTFKPGVAYSFKWDNYGCETNCKIISRTKSTAIITTPDKPKKHRVKIRHCNYGEENAEYLYPTGKYSMCPICTPSKPVSLSSFTPGSFYGDPVLENAPVAECLRVDGDRVFFKLHYHDGSISPAFNQHIYLDLEHGTEYVNEARIAGISILHASDTIPVPEWANPRTPQAQAQKMVRFEVGQTYCGHFECAGKLPIFFTVIKREGETLTVTNNRNSDTDILFVKDWSVGDDRKEAIRWYYGARSWESISITAKDRPTPADKYDLYYIPTTYAGNPGYHDIDTGKFIPPAENWGHWTELNEHSESIEKYSDGTDYFEWRKSLYLKQGTTDNDGIRTVYVGNWVDITFNRKNGRLEPAQISCPLPPDEVEAWKKWRRTRNRKPRPAVVEQQASAPMQEVRHEAWQNHTCNHCKHAPTWTHEQFITGILLAREYKKSSSRDSRTLWLVSKCNLIQIYRLAKSLGLDIPKFELISEISKTYEKKLQIAHIIWNEIISMEHVYICTYEQLNPPALPAELVTIVPPSATPKPHTDTVKNSAGKYSSFSDEQISACTNRTQLAELFSHAANKQVLLDTLHRLGFSSTGLKGISTKQKLAGYLASKIYLLGEISKLTITAKTERPKPQVTAPAVKAIEGKHGQLMLDFGDTENTGKPSSQPVAVKSKPRTTRKPSVKRDHSRQLAFVFDEVTDCKGNEGKAA